METTRTKIVAILRRGEATIEELTHALDLAPATIRRHLDILQRDGFVRVWPVRRETGRPHYAFALTEAGGDLLPHHYIRITTRLIEEIVALRPGETAGRSGRELASLLFERLAEDLADAYEPRIDGATLAERIDQTVAVLADEGLVFEVEPQEDAYLFRGIECPCRRLAGPAGDEVCGHDQRLLGRLLQADVEALGGEGSCVYRVRPRPSG